MCLSRCMCTFHAIQEMEVTFLNPAPWGLGLKLMGIFMFSYKALTDFSWADLSLLIVDFAKIVSWKNNLLLSSTFKFINLNFSTLLKKHLQKNNFFFSPSSQCFRALCCKGPPPARPEYDLVCIGLTGSGKTSLLSQLCSESLENIVSTTGRMLPLFHGVL